MDVIAAVRDMRAWRAARGDAPVGFVPTMGALHPGHRALLDRARQDAGSRGQVVASIFVNAPQFNDPRDCTTYPQPLEADLALCREAGVDAVFTPRHDELYADGYRFRVTETADSRVLEGEHRPGHFDGVLTVVLKLLLIVAPSRAYFGEKDWQQLQLVSDLALAFHLPVEIVPCPTVRDPDGLALSSRNVRLRPAARAKAPGFAAALREAPSPDAAHRRLEADGFSVEYVAERWGRRLGAVQLDGVRLIDNFALKDTAARASEMGGR